MEGRASVPATGHEGQGWKWTSPFQNYYTTYKAENGHEIKLNGPYSFDAKIYKNNYKAPLCQPPSQASAYF